MTLLSVPALAETELRIATLIPKSSYWGRLFEAWDQALQKKTNGAAKLRVYYNGVQGQETGMVSKLKSGQLDGAAITSIGLSLISKDVLVMQLPGLVDTWAKADRVRAALEPDIQKEFARKGFRLLHLGEGGLVHQMSRGFAVRRPTDIRGHRPLVIRNEPVAPAFYSIVGGVVPVPMAIMEILPALRAKTVDVIAAPCLAAEQLQWAPQLDHIAERVTVVGFGGTVFRESALEALPAEIRSLLLTLHARIQEHSSARLRRQDEEAYQRLIKKMTLVRHTPAERKEWDVVLDKTLTRLSHGTLSRELMEKVAKLVDYRLPWKPRG